jgi:hypothetical protein
MVILELKCHVLRRQIQIFIENIFATINFKNIKDDYSEKIAENVEKTHFLEIFETPPDLFQANPLKIHFREDVRRLCDRRTDGQTKFDQ